MFEENMGFEEALAKATELGYAEADPTADVEGLDAGRKVAIMASIAFHSRVVFDDVYTEEKYKITAEDITYAKEFDSVIKLLGVARNTEKGIEAGVYPMMLHKDHPLASVRDSFNAVFVSWRRGRRCHVLRPGCGRNADGKRDYGGCDQCGQNIAIRMQRTDQLYLLQSNSGKGVRRSGK